MSRKEKQTYNKTLKALPLIHVLKNAPKLQKTLAHAEQLQSIEHAMANFLPALIVPHLKYAPGENDASLNLLVRNNAISTRLNHMAPSILEFLNQQGWAIQKIKIRILPETFTKPIVRDKNLSLSAVGAVCLDQLRTLSSVFQKQPLKK